MSATRIIPNSKAPQKLRVAAYCRVCTRAAEQQSSLMAQKHYYEDYITFAKKARKKGSGMLK